LRNPKEPESSYLRSQYPTIVTLILNPKIQNHTKEILRRYPISNDKLTLVQNIIFTQLSATANFTEQLKESRHHEHSHLSKFLIRSIVN
ncbi:hypothetical protein, partial [Parachlamydia acanthamoebae]|uniref:hypothetical protein n=1 Tax=Parachlamydia acanthamoebae TaxID=83552 RepID=UPI0019D3FF8E